ncbi:MAG: hypothetical protein U0Z53_29070 [Blastocatellia bacterium]
MKINKSGTPSLATTLPGNNSKLTGRIAGEDLDLFDACYIKASDGKVYRSSGAAANAAAKVRGYAATKAKAGEAVTLIWNVSVRYGSGLAPGTSVYLDDSAPGAINDAPTTGGTGEIGFVVDATRIYLTRSTY